MHDCKLLVYYALAFLKVKVNAYSTIRDLLKDVKLEKSIMYFIKLPVSECNSLPRFFLIGTDSLLNKALKFVSVIEAILYITLPEVFTN